MEIALFLLGLLMSQVRAIMSYQRAIDEQGAIDYKSVNGI